VRCIQLALEAMATRFELVIHGEELPPHLRAAGEEALSEIQNLENRLSFYRPNSEIGRVNRFASQGPVQVSGGVFRLLQQAFRLYRRTHGAFDITVAPLMRCWGFVRGQGQWPDSKTLKEARALTGMQHLTLNEEDRTVSFQREGMSIDLGSIGKGYAIDEAIKILQECGVRRALLHGGTSTIAAIGAPPETDAWRVALPTARNDEKPLAVVDLHNETLSVSAEWGKAFSRGEKTYGHVIDPRKGEPVQGAELSAVTHRSATIADALSTALLVMTPEERADMLSNLDAVRLLVAYGPANVYTNGIDLQQYAYSPKL